MPDEAIGPLVARRLGREVVDQLADPLIGGIHAGSVDTMSAAAVFPPLLEAAARPGSLMRNLRPYAPPPDPDSPVFLTVRSGLSRIVDRLADELRRRGAELHTGVAVRSVSSDDGQAGRWRLRTAGGDAADGAVSADAVAADAVLLAVPAGAAAKLVGDVDPELAGLLGAIAYSSVALVTMRFAATSVGAPLEGTGFLVPRTGGALLTACTWLSSKWPHLSRPDDVLVRVSAGRFGDERPSTMDDDALVDRAVSELAPVLGLSGRPLAHRVARFDDAFPQYEVGHVERVAAIERAGARCGLAVAGAALRGVGIPACIASGRQAARQVLDRLDIPVRR
jgi:oxygen-dependent protoporphyrinogen oxidase